MRYADSLTGGLLSGAKESAPLHVRLQNVPNMQPNALVAAFRNVFSFFATIVVIMTLWVIGAAAEGTLQVLPPHALFAREVSCVY